MKLNQNYKYDWRELKEAQRAGFGHVISRYAERFFIAGVVVGFLFTVAIGFAVRNLLNAL